MNQRADELSQQYGELLTTEDIAKILRYPSAEAVVKAHLRGALPVPLAKFPHRRGWYATVEVVAECLDGLDRKLRRADR